MSLQVQNARAHRHHHHVSFCQKRKKIHSFVCCKQLFFVYLKYLKHFSSCICNKCRKLCCFIIPICCRRRCCWRCFRYGKKFNYGLGRPFHFHTFRSYDSVIIKFSCKQHKFLFVLQNICHIFSVLGWQFGICFLGGRKHYQQIGITVYLSFAV